MNLVSDAHKVKVIMNNYLYNDLTVQDKCDGKDDAVKVCFHQNK